MHVYTYIQIIEYINIYTYNKIDVTFNTFRFRFFVTMEHGVILLHQRTLRHHRSPGTGLTTSTSQFTIEPYIL